MDAFYRDGSSGMLITGSLPADASSAMALFVVLDMNGESKCHFPKKGLSLYAVGRKLR